MNVKAELEDVYQELNNQTTHIKEEWVATNPDHRPTSIYAMRDVNGRYLYGDLLVAQAKVLVALSLYQD